MTVKELQTELEELKVFYKKECVWIHLKNWIEATTEQDGSKDDNTGNIKLVEE